MPARTIEGMDAPTGEQRRVMQRDHQTGVPPQRGQCPQPIRCGMKVKDASSRRGAEGIRGDHHTTCIYIRICHFGCAQRIAPFYSKLLMQHIRHTCSPSPMCEE